MSDAYQIKINRALTKDRYLRAVDLAKELEELAKKGPPPGVTNLPFMSAGAREDQFQAVTDSLGEFASLPVNTADYTPWYNKANGFVQIYEAALVAWRPAAVVPSATKTKAKKSDDDDTSTMLLIAGIGTAAVIALAVYYIRRR